MVATLDGLSVSELSSALGVPVGWMRSDVNARWHVNWRQYGTPEFELPKTDALLLAECQTILHMDSNVTVAVALFAHSARGAAPPEPPSPSASSATRQVFAMPRFVVERDVATSSISRHCTTPL